MIVFCSQLLIGFFLLIAWSAETAVSRWRFFIGVGRARQTSGGRRTGKRVRDRE